MVGGGSGDLLSGFGFFFSFGGGFGNARLDLLAGLSNGSIFSGFLDNFFFSFGGAVDSFFLVSLSWKASKSFFHPAFGIGGSQLLDRFAMVDKIRKYEL